MESVRHMRREKGLSQQELADLAGVGQDSISAIETGKHEPHPRTLRKLAEALDVEVADFFREPALSGKAEAPREAGPTLLDQGRDAVRHDEEKDLRARARLDASGGTPQVTHSYEEDKFRAKLRARGYPDGDFESFTWPLIVMAHRLEEENARLKKENARLRKEAEQETVHR